jgi:hypothetical protein
LRAAPGPLIEGGTDVHYTVSPKAVELVKEMTVNLNTPMKGEYPIAVLRQTVIADRTHVGRNILPRFLVHDADHVAIPVTAQLDLFHDKSPC